MIYQVCSHCAVALTNGDMTGLGSFYGDEKMTRIEERIEALGLVAMTGSLDPGWWFDCDVCEENCLGEICTFETV